MVVLLLWSKEYKKLKIRGDTNIPRIEVHTCTKFEKDTVIPPPPPPPPPVCIQTPANYLQLLMQVAHRGWSLLREELTLREELVEDGVLAAVGRLFQAPIEKVIVLVHKTEHGISHLSCVVKQPELVPVDRLSPLVVEHLVRDEVLVLSDRLDKLR